MLLVSTPEIPGIFSLYNHSLDLNFLSLRYICGRGRIFTGCCPNPPVIKKLSTKKLKSAIMGENPKEDRTHP